MLLISEKQWLSIRAVLFVALAVIFLLSLSALITPRSVAQSPPTPTPTPLILKDITEAESAASLTKSLQLPMQGVQDNLKVFGKVDVLETLVVPANGSLIQTSFNLKRDIWYMVTVTGEYIFGNCDPIDCPNGAPDYKRKADAEYVTEDNWQTQSQSYTYLEINGADPYLGPFNADHRYDMKFMWVAGNDRPLTFRIIDCSYCYPDNSGALTVEVVAFEAPQTDLSLEQSIQVTNKLSPYFPNNLTLETVVRNQSTSTSVSDAVMSFYDGDPDNDGSLINAFIVPTINPGTDQEVKVEWSLNGNIENHRVYARVAPINDPNPGNNTISRALSVYYVEFKHNRDAYNFANAKGALQYTTSDLKESIRRLIVETDLNAWTFGPLYAIIGRFAEKAGHCYGMSSTSTLYYTRPDLKPVQEDTFDMTVDQSLGNIKRYQRWQLMDIASQRLFHSFNAQNAYLTTRNSIKSGTPIIHGVVDSNRTGGHAVVAYKVVEFGEEKRVFYYDPNNPLTILDTQQEQETYGTFHNDSFYYPGKFLLNTDYTMDEVYPMHPTESIDNVIRTTNRALAKYFSDLFASGKAIITTDFLSIVESVSVTSSGVSVTIYDPQGRRIGIVDGNIINEIPGATIDTFDSSQFFTVPRDLVYTVEVSATTNQAFSLYASFPIDSSTARSLEYTDHTIASGIDASVLLGLSNADVTMQIGDQEVGPSLDTTTSIPQVGLYDLYLPLIIK